MNFRNILENSNAKRKVLFKCITYNYASYLSNTLHLK